MNDRSIPGPLFFVGVLTRVSKAGNVNADSERSG